MERTLLFLLERYNDKKQYLKCIKECNLGLK